MVKVTKRPRYAKLNGITYPEMFSPKCLKETLEYEPAAGDVFVCTYPKCGTTWMQNVATYILRRGKEIETSFEFLKVSPFIDMLGREGIDGMPRPGAFKTHLPYSCMPYSPEAKYIFVARNPKDCCVSFYHHTRNQPGYGFWDGEFDDFFELFMAGEVDYNDYFDHLLGWYPHRNDRNAFYTTYEDMIKDIRTTIFRLSKFLGQKYSEAIEKDNSVLNNIILFSGFDYMKRKLSEIYEMGAIRPAYEGLQFMADFTASLATPEDLPGSQFIRKGVVGDWKSLLSAEQAERVDERFREKLKGTEILKWYPLH